jgi:hypothetical protein
MNDKNTLIRWFEDAIKTMDIDEQVRFIREIFYELEEGGIKLPLGDYDQVERYLINITNKLEEK